ncbi:AraC family transcriptional regulator [Actinomadura sp. 1N219]|uniref:AraC family transcriptional regulator n=1 Tax=Actinomadura sp. 1N219 TaxID=3375152 RepID=UPI0037A6A9B4
MGASLSGAPPSPSPSPSPGPGPGSLDVLSDAIASVRLGRPYSSRTVLEAPFGLRFPAFPGAGLHMILRGSCWLIPSGGTPVVLDTGDVVLLPRGMSHGVADVPHRSLTAARFPLQDVLSDGTDPCMDGRRADMLCGAYLLDRSRSHPLLAELPDVVHIPARGGGHPSLRGAVELLERELGAGQRPGFGAALPALLDILLLYTLRAWFDDRPSGEATGWTAALRDPAVAAALRGIHHEPERPWTVQSLADLAQLSRAAFARRFAELAGTPPLSYLTWWRMTSAARLLRTTDLPLRSVADRVGYASDFAFAKAFRREYGEPPGRYRLLQTTAAEEEDGGALPRGRRPLVR